MAVEMIDNDAGWEQAQEDGLPDNITPGSPMAKMWWTHNVDAHITDGVTPEMKAKYGGKVVGTYKGKPLVPGEAGPGQGDFQYLVDKLIVVNGVDYATAAKIAGKAKARMIR